MCCVISLWSVFVLFFKLFVFDFEDKCRDRFISINVGYKYLKNIISKICCLV